MGAGLKVQARPPQDQRLATQSRVSGREGKESAVVILKCFIKCIINNIGCAHIWWSQCECINSISLLKELISNKSMDQLLQTWYSQTDNSSKSSSYKMYKNSVTCEHFLRIKLSKHNPPKETGYVDKLTLKS